MGKKVLDNLGEIDPKVMHNSEIISLTTPHDSPSHQLGYTRNYTCTVKRVCGNLGDTQTKVDI